MPRMRTLSPVLATLGIWGAAIPGHPAAEAIGQSVEQVRWLAGCLEMRSGDRVVEEQRMGVRGASMLGMARTTTSKGLIEPDSVVFAAPEHDYPQIVGYRRSGADSVVAWIDGTSGGKPRRIEFSYRRVACSG